MDEDRKHFFSEKGCDLLCQGHDRDLHIFFSEGLPGLPCNLRRSDVGPGVPGPVTAGQKELYLFPLFPSLKRAPQGERKAGLKARKGRDHVNKKTQKLIHTGSSFNLFHRQV